MKVTPLVYAEYVELGGNDSILTIGAIAGTVGGRGKTHVHNLYYNREGGVRSLEGKKSRLPLWQN